MIQDWATKRQELARKQIQEEIECRLEEEDLVDRPSKAFLKLRVADVDSILEEADFDCTHMAAFLTVWEPSEGQLDFLQEGAFFEMSSLSVKEELYEGDLQLSANSRTAMIPINVELCDEHASLSRAIPISMMKLHVISREHNLQDNHLFGMYGVLVAISETSLGWTMVVVDHSGLALRIESCESHRPALKIFSIVIFEDLLSTGYDDYEGWAIAEFTKDSLVYAPEDPSNPHIKYLNDWLEAGVENPRFASIASLAQSRLRMSNEHNETDFEHSIAFINDFEISNGGCLIVSVEDLTHHHKWRLPLSLISRLQHLRDERSTTIAYSEQKEQRILNLSSLCCILRHRTWLSFVLKPCNEDRECQYEVVDVYKAQVRWLLRLYCYNTVKDLTETD